MTSKFKLTVRYAPAVYGTKILDEGMTEEEALEFAKEVARKGNHKCCLQSPQGKEFWISKKGEVGFTTRGKGPSMSVGGQKFELVETDEAEPKS